MLVTIEERCSRCKRGSSRQVDSAEIPALEADVQARKDAIAKFQELLNQAQIPNLPDVIVLFKGKMTTIDKVCESCVSTVQNHFESVFKEIDPSKRKPRQPKEKKAAPPAAEAVNGKKAPSEVKGKK